MFIVHHAHLPTQRLDGELRLAAADRSLGIDAFQVWLHRLEPGAHGGACHHNGELVVLVLAGCGKLLVAWAAGPVSCCCPCCACWPHRCSP